MNSLKQYAYNFNLTLSHEDNTYKLSREGKVVCTSNKENDIVDFLNNLSAMSVREYFSWSKALSEGLQHTIYFVRKGI